MLRKKCIVILVCLCTLFSSIPTLSLAAPITVTDNILTIPFGGRIQFSGDDTFMYSAVGVTGGILTSNVTPVFCNNSNTCTCPTGMVVKAPLSVNCPAGYALSGSYLDVQSTAGVPNKWGVDCLSFNIIMDLGNAGHILGVNTLYAAPDSFVLGCVTP